MVFEKCLYKQIHHFIVVEEMQCIEVLLGVFIILKFYPDVSSKKIEQ